MDWSINKARQCYNLQGWGEGYFNVNENGHLTVRPCLDAETPEIDLSDLATEVRGLGLRWPVLVRCSGILRSRVKHLCNAFDSASKRHHFHSSYTIAYPVKVNQQFEVINQIVHSGDQVGLEVGSKAELMAVLGVARPDSLIICNGYKDREYIRLSLIAQRLGLRVYLVIEKLSELDLIIEQANELDITPLLGVRLRLTSVAGGNWQNSGGEKSKFGLNVVQVLGLVERLKAVNLLHQLQLIHFHLGSQLTDLEDIRQGMQEAARFYVELHGLGVPIAVLDAGGGLGIDYEGTASRSFCSKNYSIEQYACVVVETLQRICTENNLPHPTLVTESGRAMTAHHAFLVTNVIDTEQLVVGETLPVMDAVMPDTLRNLQQLHQQLPHLSVLETYSQAQCYMDEVQKKYNQGLLNLKQRAWAEHIWISILHGIQNSLQPDKLEHRKLIEKLHKRMADKYFCNLSIFQSLPDVWGIDQIFPIVPLQRLNERPTRRAVLHDLTCDSDGHIEHYVGADGVASSLPVHALNLEKSVDSRKSTQAIGAPGKAPMSYASFSRPTDFSRLKQADEYLLGIFLVGAYQEILGDMHNLFGDTDTVNLENFEDGSWQLSQPEPGDRTDELLSYVHFDPDRLREVYRQRIQRAQLGDGEAEQFMAELEAGLSGYTYLEK